jgi:adenylate kinase family enzyme
MSKVEEDRMLEKTLKPDLATPDHLNLYCLDSTRKELLSFITAWLDDTAEPNILWLCGAPGTGKTAIAWSLIAELEIQQRSAGGFFFRPHQNSPSQLWCTLAYKMAKFHPAIKREVHKALKREVDKTPRREEDKFPRDDIQLIFDQLISEPLKSLAARLSTRNSRPVVLIDGLEQCIQGYPNWQALLDTLPQWLDLPRHYKLIITGRPQHDIAKVLEGKDIKRMELFVGDDADYSTHDDVRTYLHYRFAEMRKQDKSIPDYWPNDDAISKLVIHTNGFFKWAALAVDAIQADGERERHLTTIIEGGTTTTFDSFDQYLEGILRIAFDNYPFETFRATMGAIALSKQPLTMDDLSYFLQHRFPSPSGVSLEDMCSRLSPIISIEGEEKVIRIRHKAYNDYLLDSKRCGPYDHAFFIDRNKAQSKMTISCLRIMQQGLKFNICGLKSSYKMNYQIDDISALVNRCIPSYLAYACQYWADHLRGIVSNEKRDADIVNLLRNFLNFHLLYWLGALSLLSVSHTAPKSLLIAAEWLEVYGSPLSISDG